MMDFTLLPMGWLLVAAALIVLLLLALLLANRWHQAQVLQQQYRTANGGAIERQCKRLRSRRPATRCTALALLDLSPIDDMAVKAGRTDGILHTRRANPFPEGSVYACYWFYRYQAAYLQALREPLPYQSARATRTVQTTARPEALPA